MKESKKILVVEDDNDSRTALCYMLGKLDFECLDYAHAQHALDALENEHKNSNISLCLLDIMMPDINGFQLLHKLKENPRFTNTPCIMVTARNEDDEVIEGYQSGADYYITKPYTISQLKYGITICLEPESEAEK